MFSGVFCSSIFFVGAERFSGRDLLFSRFYDRFNIQLPVRFPEERNARCRCSSEWGNSLLPAFLGHLFFIEDSPVCLLRYTASGFGRWVPVRCLNSLINLDAHSHRIIAAQLSGAVPPRKPNGDEIGNIHTACCLLGVS